MPDASERVTVMENPSNVATRALLARVAANQMAGQPLGVPEIVEVVSRPFLDALSAAQAEIARLREAVVACVVPYEALLVDTGSRQWIAPSVWVEIQRAVETARAALTRGEEGQHGSL